MVEVEEHPPSTGEAQGGEGVLRRIRRNAIVAAVVLAAGYAIRGDLWGVSGLTCGAAVAIVNFLWLENLVRRAIGSAPDVRPEKVAAGSLLRFALFGLVLAISIFVARFNVLSVLLGVSVLVIGIAGEAVYALVAPRKALRD